MNPQKEIVLMLNSECNNSCKCCYLPYSGKREPDNALKLTKSLQSQSYKVSFAGSEILLDPRYLDSYQQASQEYILTNGKILLEKPELFKIMQNKGIKQLKISMNSEIGKDQGFVSNEIVKKAVKISKQNGFSVNVFHMITSNNYLDVFDACEAARTIGADAIEFNRYFISGKGKDHSLVPSSEQRQDFFNLVDLARERYDKQELEIIIRGILGPKRGTKGETLAKENNYCPAGKDLLVVSPNNTIYGCVTLMEYPIGQLVNNVPVITQDLCNGQRDCCISDLINKE